MTRHHHWTRRRFLRAGAAALAGGLGVGLYTWRIEPHWIQLTHRDLPIAGLPRGLAGATLVQLSDLHVGPRVDSGYLIRVLKTVAALAPEIVVFTGDFISYNGLRQLDELGRVLEHWPLGRLATVAIFGNHDYGVSWRQPEVAEDVAKRARDAGITVLRNQTLEVRGLELAGLDDLWSTNFHPVPVLAGLQPDRPTLVLSHNPDTVDRPIWSDYRGWILSGHTHGGQCKPPFLPPPILPIRNPAYAAGEVALSGDRRLYVNRGVGHLTRVRFNVRPEVTIFTLTRAASLKGFGGRNAMG